jgi:hypothetical protein
MPEPGRLARLRGASIALLMVLASLVGGGAVSCLGRAFFPPARPPANVTVVRPTPQVIVAVRDLARLEAAEYHLERVIDLREQQSRFFGLINSEDAILLVAAGDVTAGVDLTQLRDGDVVVDTVKREATIVLPRAQVLSTRLDNERTYVHTRRTDALAQRRENLETRARQEAERTLEQAALTGGVLERAQRNAERTVETLVRSLGYTRVSVRTRGVEE